MLTLHSENNKSSALSLFITTSLNQNSTHLLTDNLSLIAPSFSEGGMDVCSFYSGPSDATIMAFGESSESCGSIAFSDGGESCGSIAFSGGGESCGSIASSGDCSGGGCSYSC